MNPTPAEMSAEALTRALGLLSDVVRSTVLRCNEPTFETLEQESDAIEALRLFLSQHLRAPGEDTERCRACQEGRTCVYVETDTGMACK